MQSTPLFDVFPLSLRTSVFIKTYISYDYSLPSFQMPSFLILCLQRFQVNGVDGTVSRVLPPLEMDLEYHLYDRGKQQHNTCILMNSMAILEFKVPNSKILKTDNQYLNIIFLRKVSSRVPKPGWTNFKFCLRVFTSTI